MFDGIKGFTSWTTYFFACALSFNYTENQQSETHGGKGGYKDDDHDRLGFLMTEGKIRVSGINDTSPFALFQMNILKKSFLI